MKSDVTLFRRIGSIGYDFFLVFSFVFFVAGVVILVNNKEPITNSFFFFLVTLPAIFLYFSISWVKGRQTLGMRAWKFEIVQKNGENITFKQSFVRFSLAIVSLIVLGLIFLKYISDTFDIQKNKIKQMVSDPKSDLFISKDPKVFEKELEDRDYYTQDNVFWVPQKARWEKIRAQAKQPDIGSIVDKIGISKATIYATLLVSGNFLLCGLSNNLLTITLSHFFLGLGTAVGFGPLIADITHWFVKRRGIAVAIIASGNYLSGVVWSPLIGNMIGQVTWRDTYLSIAIILPTVVIPFAYLLCRKTL